VGLSGERDSAGSSKALEGIKKQWNVSGLQLSQRSNGRRTQAATGQSSIYFLGSTDHMLLELSRGRGERIERVISAVIRR
jgi:hypothetical protein